MDPKDRRPKQPPPSPEEVERSVQEQQDDTPPPPSAPADRYRFRRKGGAPVVEGPDPHP